jgi:tetratricopeptide (TPR) repeat protein
MRPRGCLMAFALLGLTTAPLCVAAGCKLVKRGELPVTMSGLAPLVHARIDDTDALFIADSGAFFSMLTPAAAAELKLHLSPAPFGISLTGVGGEAHMSVTTVPTFTIFGVTIPKVEFIVAGNDLGGGAAGLLGQNVFRLADDVEYDLANGIIRLFTPDGCRHTPLAYWAVGHVYSVIEIARATPLAPHTAGVAFLDGARIRVFFDTGSPTSMLTLGAAKRAGVTPETAGVVASGPAVGIGRQLVPSWIAPFASFKIGDEEVRNTRLRIGASGIRDVDMLIGADFFLSHRIYVANSQEKLYFTYNGGPVFNLTATPVTANANAAPNAAPPGTSPDSAAPDTAAPNAPEPNAPAQAAAASAAAASAAAASAAAASAAATDQPTDAAAFSRRGTAFAARHEYPSAIADLTRACELAPSEASYFYQRAVAYWGDKQPEAALGDLDQALKLKPDDVPALVVRAELHAHRRENAAAIADLDAASRLVPREAPVHIQLADLYLRLDQLAPAVAEYSFWIDSHGRDDVRMPHALNARCLSRGLSGQQLNEALGDCNAALRLRPDTAAYFGSRGLVQLRRAEYDKAITDFDRALAVEHADAWAYYGRGVAKLRKGLTADGQADIAAATALAPTIATAASKHGIAP